MRAAASPRRWARTRAGRAGETWPRGGTAARLALLGFGLLPETAQFLLGLGLGVPKYMGMPVDHLGRDPRGHFRQGKIAPFLIEVAQEHQVQQQVPQFLFDLAGDQLLSRASISS